MSLIVNPKAVNFQLPTQYSDGSALPASDITQIKIGAGSVSGSYTKFVVDTNLVPDATGQCHYPVASLGLGQGNWFLALFTDTQNGMESAPSNEVGITLAVAPNPPKAVSAS